MAAEHEGSDVFDRDVELVGEKKAEPRGIQHARHAHYLLVRQARCLLQCPDHGIERVGDADDESVGCIFLDPCPDLLHHLEIDREEIVAAHARLARHARGDDAHLGVVERFIGIGAGEGSVEPIDRRGLRDVERFALRHAFGDVEHHDVAKFLQADQMGQCSADLTGANQSNLVARHGNLSFEPEPGRRWKSSVWLSLSTHPFKSRRAQLSATPVNSGRE